MPGVADFEPPKYTQVIVIGGADARACIASTSGQAGSWAADWRRHSCTAAFQHT